MGLRGQDYWLRETTRGKNVVSTMCGDLAVIGFSVLMFRSPTHSDGLFPNGSVSVFNAERQKTPTGKAKLIHGYAYRPDPKEEGRLTVKLQGAPIAPCKLSIASGDDTTCVLCIVYSDMA